MAKILLVEDDNNLRDIYGERLLAEGYDIISASDGEEALQLAAQQKPDLIISDVMMPKISGFDMLDILRQTPDTKDIKIIMMTALSQAEDKTRADSLGADKYLVKSQVTLEDVARVVHDILGDAPAEAEELPTDEPAAQAAEPTVAAQPVVAAPEPVVTPPAAPVAQPVVPEPVVAAPVVEPAVEPSPEPTVTATPEPVAPATDSALPTSDLTNDLPSDPMPSMTGTTITPTAAPEPVASVAPAADDGQSNPDDTAQPEAPAATPSKPVFNPITGDLGGANEAGAQNESDSQAATTDAEMADVAKQIENFVANEGQVAEHTEPVKEPTEQDIIHAMNANEDPTVVPAATANVPQSSTTLPASEQAAPVIAPNPTIPPLASQMDTGNPEPASNRKKIIQPINDVSTPNINDLFEKQMAQEAAQSNVVEPAVEAPAPAQAPTEVINPVLQEEEQVINPIATNTDPVEEKAPELETIDVNSITGIQEPEDDGMEIPIPGQLPTSAIETPEATAVDAITGSAPEQAPVMPVTEPAPAPAPVEETPISPDDPNNFAL